MEAPSVPATFVPKWQRERLRRLHRNFLSVERRLESGQKLGRAIGWFAWWYKNERRFYRCDPDRRIHFAAKTLIMLLYRWRDGGRQPGALALHFRGPSKIGAIHVHRFAKGCLKPGATSLATAYGQGKRQVATVSAFRHALPIAVRKPLLALFDARRRVKWLERRAQRVVEKFESGGVPI